MSGDLTERRVQAIREVVDEYGMALTMTNIKRIVEADPATELLGLATALADEAADHLHTDQDVSRVRELARAFLVGHDKKSSTPA